jgi:predicted nucleic acid-binding protein
MLRGRSWEMIITRVEPIQAHVFQKQERLFLDANVWLSVYGPVVRRRARSAIYSRALASIRNVGCPIFLDVIIVSEFINAFARMEHKQSTSPNLPFKEFRKSTDFKAIAKDIAQNAKRIVSQCQRCESGFTSADINAPMSEFERGDFDFNDQMIAGICREKEFQLVTDDGDFKNVGLSILTANNFLLTS